MKQVTYTSIGVGTTFFVFMSMLGGNAAVSRYLEKDKATTHNTKFLAHVSHFITAHIKIGYVQFAFSQTEKMATQLKLT